MRVNAASISGAKTRQPVCFCRYWQPPTWSAFECVTSMPRSFHEFLSSICLTLRPASLSLPLSMSQTSLSEAKYSPIFAGQSI